MPPRHLEPIIDIQIMNQKKNMVNLKTIQKEIKITPKNANLQKTRFGQTKNAKFPLNIKTAYSSANKAAL